MIFDVVRFNHFALDVLRAADESENDPSAAGKGSRKVPSRKKSQESIGQYLERENYSEGFINDYLMPMTACVWSTSPDKCSLNFPAVTLIRFLWNHHLLNTISERAPWMTIRGGTSVYVAKALRGFESIHLGETVRNVRRNVDGTVSVFMVNGEMEIFDHVVLATHGDQALEIVRDTVSPVEKGILSHFKSNKSVAVLHNDLSVRIMHV